MLLKTQKNLKYQQPSFILKESLRQRGPPPCAASTSIDSGLPNPMHDSNCDGESTRPVTRYSASLEQQTEANPCEEDARA
ncbi:hypothetical protein ERO13_D05G374150v2 [Gossypium hirsutum]|nr:hypothetical protein ERO13_D05G374150v2 [Gossypium hirsutum]